MNNNNNDRDGGDAVIEDQLNAGDALRSVARAVRASYAGQIVYSLIEELFPWLLNREHLRNSFLTSLKKEPCITMFYSLLVVFGFLPCLGFCFFIGGSFFLTIVCFAASQLFMVILAGFMFGGLFVFLVGVCFTVAVMYGSFVHFLYGWGSFNRFLAEMGDAAYESIYGPQPPKEAADDE